MFTPFVFILLMLFGFVFKNEGFSNFLLYMLIIFIVFILLLQVYYIQPESTTANMPTSKSKSIKKKRDLERAFDAILNKNTSSSD
ncbi:ac76 [Malacosoma neustria nucleopolyhedrovirus]|jgi:uncharacterized protein YpmB|nr:ac76 [Malacosoma neustria nucleopolyhedrovirus]AUF81586.1 ac76 [Malacosoma neustria nucleopolyhedrovirus]